MQFATERNILFLSLFLLFFDALNGFFIAAMQLDLKISVLFKFGFISICLCYLIKKCIGKFYFCLLLILYSLIWAILKNISTDGKYIFLDFSELFKLTSTVIVFITFSTFNIINPKHHIRKLFLVSVLVLLVNVIVGVLGFGSTSYGGYGFKGFFYAGNALSGIIIIIFGYSLYVFSESKLKIALSFLVLFTIAILLGTKSAILGLILLSIITQLNLRRFSNSMMVISGCLTIIIAIFVLYDEILKTEAYIRIMFFYDTGGLTRVLLSGRDVFFNNIYPEFINSPAHHLLFGLGFNLLSDLGKPLVEMDFFDIIFIFGILVFSLYLLFLLYVVSSIKKISVHSDVKRQVLSTYFVMFIIAFIAGHVFFNGIVTPFLGVLLAIPFWHKKFSLYKD